MLAQGVEVLVGAERGRSLVLPPFLFPAFTPGRAEDPEGIASLHNT